MFILWVELAYYLGGVEYQQFSVDKNVVQTVQVNIDITVNVPCGSVHVAGLDDSHDRLVAQELVSFQGVDSIDFDKGVSIFENAERMESFHDVLRRARKSNKFTRHKDTPNGDACRIYGSFPINKVEGELYLTSRRIGGNFSHIIDELSFGDYYPKLVNPLDGVSMIAEDNNDIFQYFLSIVPTTYQSFSTGRTIVTNQYAVTEEPGRKSQAGYMPPGIYFKYGFEPISLYITDKRLPFTQFLVRLVSIVGGMVACASWLYQAYDTMAIKLFKSKGSSEKKRSLLDGVDKSRAVL